MTENGAAEHSIHAVNEDGNLSGLSEKNFAINVPQRTLQRGTFRSFINICVDIFGIMWWAGMLAYAALLWHYNGTLVQDMSFPATRLLNAARPVSFPSTLLQICL